MRNKSLAEILIGRKNLTGKGITFIEGASQEEFLSYAALYEAALKGLSFLRHSGLQPGDELVLQIDDHRIFIITFWACILGGIIPVPLTVGQNDEHKQKLFNIWGELNHPFLMISRENLDKTLAFAGSKGLGDTGRRLKEQAVDPDGIGFSRENVALVESREDAVLFESREDDIAFIQFSSGSTGNPKGVILTHKNLLVNMAAIGKAAGYTDKDSMISWMPLTHDMGLIGFHLNPLFEGMDQFLIPVHHFVRRPALWLDKASEHKATILCSPNFGYKYLMKHADTSSKHDWDLSGVRIIYNGAEPISEKICHDFLESLSGYGLRPQAMCPVYGLAEASLAVSISALQEEVVSVRLDRKKLNPGDKISLKGPDEEGVSFVNVGKAIENCSIQITGPDNKPLGEDRIGNVRIKGENVTAGYYNNRLATDDIMTGDGWLNTGDTGFVNNGSLYITGRAKDIIFINGQNYYSHDIERLAEEVDGIELNKIVVAGFYNGESGKDETIAFIYYRGDIRDFIPLAGLVQTHINDKAGFLIDRIIPVKDIPRTTSGKLQRFKLIERYRNGEYNHSALQMEQLSGELRTDDIPILLPENEMEEALVTIWMQVLKRDAVGVNQSFFEIGGNSLRAAEMGMLIVKQFQTEIPAAQLYETPTIRGIAKMMSQDSGRQNSAMHNVAMQNYLPLPAAPQNMYYPVSQAQKNLYYFWALDKSSIAYNIPLAFRISGKSDEKKFPDRQQLEDCIRRMIHRHDSLRMNFQLNGEPVFTVHDTVGFDLSSLKCTGEDLQQTLAKLVRPFDLHNGPLFRIILLDIEQGLLNIEDGKPNMKEGLPKMKEGDQILFMDFHHIIFDGLSVYHFLDELLMIWSGKGPTEPAIQYRNFVSWENGQIRSEKILLQERYWLDRLCDGQAGAALPVLEMPLDRQRPVMFSVPGEKLEYNIGKAVTKRLKDLAAANQCSLHVLLLTIYNVLLWKYTGQEDILVGIPVAGRRHPDLQNALGMFVNNLVIRSRIQGDKTFSEFLDSEKSVINEALTHPDYSFYQLSRAIGGKRDMSRNPVFDSMFIYQDMGLPETGTNEFSLTRHFFDPGISKFDISMEVFDDSGSLRYYIEYATSLFTRDTIMQIAGHFENLIGRIIDAPQARLSDIQILTDAVYDSYIRTFNANDASYPKDQTIHQLFEEQAGRTPDQIAIEWGNARISYQQLNERADRLAGILQQKGIGKDKVVGILLFRSPELIVSILAVLKAGGCYLPMDTDLPESRIAFLVTDSRCRLLISSIELTNKLAGIDPTITAIINMDDLQWPDTPSSGSDPVCEVTDPVGAVADLAYIIYTSGTTGKPKGVMITHRSLVNYITWAAKNYIDGTGMQGAYSEQKGQQGTQNEQKGQQGTHNEQKVQVAFALFTSISFDLTVTSIFTPLVTGNRIIIYNDEGKGLLIEQVIADNKAEIIKLTPSHLKIIAESRWVAPAGRNRIRRFIVGGEQLETRLAKAIHDKFEGGIDIYNEYGPTEATVGCMIHRFDPRINHIGSQVDGVGSQILPYYAQEFLPNVPIGIPAANTQIYVLDQFLQPVPAGVKGEIYISGDGIARGYLFNEALTQQKFIPNPFLKGQKMYKTGDIARRLPDGTIEYTGRSDQQVKINGHRIELSEIEYQLMSYDGISEALVLFRTNKKNHKSLCAYYKARILIEETALRNYLATSLPYYMIPANLVQVEHFPLTRNGKIDAGALPEPRGYRTVDATPHPESHFEQLLLSIWQEILGEDNLTVTDNFFELGGDSIKAVQIAMRLFDRGISIPVKDILTYYTIEQIGLHASISAAVNEYEQGIAAGKKGLTPIESWFFSQGFKNPGYYNQSILLRFNKKINSGMLEAAFSAIITHHDGLRMNYDREKKLLFYNQQHLPIQFNIEEHPISSENAGSARTASLETICLRVKSHFDLSDSLLIKAAIIREGDGPDMLFITAHHLVIDGISWRILLEDLYSAYTALQNGELISLPAKTAALTDWDKKLTEYAVSGDPGIRSKYWNETANTSFRVPLDFETNDWRTLHVQTIVETIPDELTGFLLKDAHKAYKTDIPVLLNTALTLTLKQWIEQEEFVIEQENHGRHLDGIDTNRTIGWFTAMYPVKLRLKDEPIGKQIKAIKEQLRGVPDHGLGYGIYKYFKINGEDVSAASKEGVPAGSQETLPVPITEIRFNYLGQFDKELNNDLFEYSDRSTGNDIDPENNMTARMELNAMVIAGELQLGLRYNQQAHKRSTIKWFLKSFTDNLELIARHIKNEDKLHFTPSDFSLDLDQEELDSLFL